MADIRTLKLALLADTKDFISGLDKADKETRTFSDKLGSALKTGALAFAALGAAVEPPPEQLEDDEPVSEKTINPIGFTKPVDDNQQS